MKIIVITRPDFFEGETCLVNQLFEHGMQRLHLRKPRATKHELAEWIEGINPMFRQRIVMHDHHELARDYALGGIHLNSRNPLPPTWIEKKKTPLPISTELENTPLPISTKLENTLRHFTVSRSCHSIAEVQQYKGELDYMFLSPIYDSISKEGYGAAFSRQQLKEAYTTGLLGDNVFALGGISADKLPELKAMGFKGAAVLGDLWMSQDPRERLSAYQQGE